MLSSCIHTPSVSLPNRNTSTLSTVDFIAESTSFLVTNRWRTAAITDFFQFQTTPLASWAGPLAWAVTSQLTVFKCGSVQAGGIKGYGRVITGAVLEE